MTNDIRLAFAHPEERAAASASADPRDRISLRDHVVEVEIGAFQQERGHTQRVMFNVVVEVRPAPQPLNDDVDRILSYDRITESIATELAAERLNLLETLAERVAERILAEPQAMRAFVRIEKLDVGPYKLGVEIVRSRAEVAVQAQADGRGAVASPGGVSGQCGDCSGGFARAAGWVGGAGAAGDPDGWSARGSHARRPGTARRSAGWTCWRSSRTPGFWRRGMRAVW